MKETLRSKLAKAGTAAGLIALGFGLSAGAVVNLTARERQIRNLNLPSQEEQDQATREIIIFHQGVDAKILDGETVIDAKQISPNIEKNLAISARAPEVKEAKERSGSGRVISGIFLGMGIVSFMAGVMSMKTYKETDGKVSKS